MDFFKDFPKNTTAAKPVHSLYGERHGNPYRILYQSFVREWNRLLRTTAKKVTALPDYKLQIVFDNGEIRIFDVRPYIQGDWFSELRDPAYFQSVAVNGFSVEWAHGQDICPDELFYDSIPV